jgi:anti-sigma B factor antagonist
MTNNVLTTSIRQVSPFIRVIDLNGEIGTHSEKALNEAYTQAAGDNIQTLVFNFSNVVYMNSFGIGMLIMLFIRAQREAKKIFGFGLNDHYRNIFQLTRLDQVMPIYSSEATALASAQPYDLPEREN